MKPLALIDLDYTLLDTHRLIKDFGSFPQIQTKLLHLKSIRQYLYPFSLDLIQNLKAYFTPAIFSEGAIKFQKQKLKQLALSDLIPPRFWFIYPPRSKAKHLAQLYQTFPLGLIIDDQGYILDQAVELSLPAIRVKTPKHRFSKSKFPPDFTVTSIQQILEKQLIQKIATPIKISQRIHFTGIKGVGMTATALALKDMGKNISGSDTPKPQITDQVLSQAQIYPKVFSARNITPQTDLVIYSGAYSPLKHPELIKASKQNIPKIPQAHALAAIMAHKQQICVCGVGGKTTTTSMLINLFLHTGMQPSWFVGTSTPNQSLPPGRIDQGKHFIVEADEYAISPLNHQPKFSLFNPSVIICTNLRFDHPDIYSSYQKTRQVFLNFFQKLPSGGLLVINYHTPKLAELLSHLSPRVKIQTFGQNSQADWQILPTGASNRHFTVKFKRQKLHFELNTPGLHNAFNATAALVVAHHLSISLDQATNSFKRFYGCKRRQELIKQENQILYYDDYAHHPHEIKAVLQSFRASFPHHVITVIFQAHTYSRTSALLKQFATSFTAANQVVTTKIFSSARETSNHQITGKKLATEIAKHHPNVKYFDTFEQIAQFINASKAPKQLYLTLGAGNIYQLHELI